MVGQEAGGPGGYHPQRGTGGGDRRRDDLLRRCAHPTDRARGYDGRVAWEEATQRVGSGEGDRRPRRAARPGEACWMNTGRSNGVLHQFI
jgi:hypothetical protein